MYLFRSMESVTVDLQYYMSPNSSTCFGVETCERTTVSNVPVRLCSCSVIKIQPCPSSQNVIKTDILRRHVQTLIRYLETSSCNTGVDTRFFAVNVCTDICTCRWICKTYRLKISAFNKNFLLTDIDVVLLPNTPHNRNATIWNVFRVIEVLHMRPCYHGPTRPRVADGGNGLQIWTVASNILNKQLRTADKGRFSSFGVGPEGNNSSL